MARQMAITYQEFLQTVKVIRMLYNVATAKKVFQDNCEQFGIDPNKISDIMVSTTSIDSNKSKDISL